MQYSVNVTVGVNKHYMATGVLFWGVVTFLGWYVFLQACAHRYVNYNPSNRNTRSVYGRCYYADRSLDDFTEFQPCSGGMCICSNKSYFM